MGGCDLSWLCYGSMLAKLAIYEAQMQVNVLEAKNRLSQLIKSVQAGEDVVIANRGEPVARLVPVVAPAAVAPERGSAAAILDWLRQNPLPPYTQRAAAEIDAAIAEERAAWD